MAAPKRAAIGPSRVVICHVAAALDISARPSHPATKLQGCVAATQGVDAVISRPPRVRAHDLGHVVTEAEDETVSVWGRTAPVCPPGGPGEIVDRHTSLQTVDRSRVLPCADRESPPRLPVRESVVDGRGGRRFERRRLSLGDVDLFVELGDAPQGALRSGWVEGGEVEEGWLKHGASAVAFDLKPILFANLSVGPAVRVASSAGVSR